MNLWKLPRIIKSLIENAMHIFLKEPRDIDNDSKGDESLPGNVDRRSQRYCELLQLAPPIICVESRLRIKTSRQNELSQGFYQLFASAIDVLSFQFNYRVNCLNIVFRPSLICFYRFSGTVQVPMSLVSPLKSQTFAQEAVGNSRCWLRECLKPATRLKRKSCWIGSRRLFTKVSTANWSGTTDAWCMSFYTYQTQASPTSKNVLHMQYQQ